MTVVQRLSAGAAVAAGLALAAAACGGGGGYNAPSPSPGGGGTGSGIGATVTITDSGASPKTVEIKAGERVRFINNDSRTHEVLTTPHLLHTDCPAVNQVGNLPSGSNKMTGDLTVERICGYHDHLNPDDTRFRGEIHVGKAEGPNPGYVTPW
jgi:plastocyanin